ncbi:MULTISPECIES: flagellin N-terminal helical domain-containing protein [unclassified Bacillus cereus group]|uniref:flagellin N-terminal helical domain-containing protein n=1 Tax=unclassified Bacillus cereus group TaxID=2750818 RepID=UPI0022E3DC07|nr:MULTISPECIES: flagellin [unclassified Bacillus cereus group]MDA2145647.1 flagellin [Bacillus cereus group sp. Bc248]MDA2173497.1 flagellin [Bacillus cereus group sp. Bc247]HDR7257826.1 flagellin [Bacillus paranthracis]
MRINTNINSMRTQEYMRQNQAKMSNAMDRLSSGKRINSAADDAAGLAIATRMRARESGLNVASRNTQDGMSLIRTADSAMNSVTNILLRMRDLANQSATGTNTKGNQASLQKEFSELTKQITYIAENTKFNDQSLLDGNVSLAETPGGGETTPGGGETTPGGGETTPGGGETTPGGGETTPGGGETTPGGGETTPSSAPVAASTSLSNTGTKITIQTLDSNLGNQQIDVKIGSVTLASLGLGSVSIGESTVAENEVNNAGDATNARSALEAIDKALTKIADNRATLGATLNRLDFNVTNLKSQENSMASSASQIEDADMAKEMSEMTKFKILNEAGISMLSQANQTPQMVSKLLQ